MKKLEEYRKFLVALVGSLASVWTIVATADLSTREGLFSTVGAIVVALGVWAVPNRPQA